MNENAEILEYIYQNAKMGAENLTSLIKILNEKNNKIKKIIEEELKEYENFIKDSEKLLKKYEATPKEKGVIANVMAYMEMKVELLKDNSDAKIADMLIKGFTMGKIDIEKKVNRYSKNAEPEIIKLAKKLAKFNNENIELLKKYL